MRKDKDNMANNIFKDAKKRKWVLRSSVASVAALGIGLSIALPWSKAAPEAMLVVDQGAIYDRSFNEGTLDGLEEAKKEQKNSFTTGALKSPRSDDFGLSETYNVLQTLGTKVIAAPGFKHTNAIAQYTSEGKHINNNKDNFFIHLDDGNSQFISERNFGNFPTSETSMKYGDKPKLLNPETGKEEIYNFNFNNQINKNPAQINREYKPINPMATFLNVWPIKFKMETVTFPLALLVGMESINKGWLVNNQWNNKANMITWGGNPFGTVYDFLSGILDGLVFFSMSFASDNKTDNDNIVNHLNGTTEGIPNVKLPENWKQATNNKLFGIMSPRDTAPVDKGQYKRDRFFTFTFSATDPVVKKTVEHSLRTDSNGNVAHYFMPVAGPQTGNMLQEISASPINVEKRVIGVDSDATKSYSNFKQYIFGSAKKDLKSVTQAIASKFFEIYKSEGPVKARKWFLANSRNRDHEGGQTLTQRKNTGTKKVDVKVAPDGTILQTSREINVDPELNDNNEPTQRSHPHNVFGFAKNDVAKVENLRISGAAAIGNEFTRSEEDIYTDFRSKVDPSVKVAWKSLSNPNSKFEDFAIEANVRFKKFFDREVASEHPAFVDGNTLPISWVGYKSFDPKTPTDLNP